MKRTGLYIITKSDTMTWLQFLNQFILQWFFIRLVRISEDGQTVGWALMTSVMPTTGWGDSYRYFPFKKGRLIKLFGRIK